VTPIGLGLASPGLSALLNAVEAILPQKYLPMSATLLEVPRTGKRRTDAKATSNDIDSAVPRAIGTRRRNRERLDKDNQQETPEDTIEEGSAEGVWFDGPLALTLLPPLGSFLTGGSSSQFA